jgi:hypothetical protein
MLAYFKLPLLLILLLFPFRGNVEEAGNESFSIFDFGGDGEEGLLVERMDPEADSESAISLLLLLLSACSLEADGITNVLANELDAAEVSFGDEKVDRPTVDESAPCDLERGDFG